MSTQGNNGSSGPSAAPGGTPMTGDAAARIQSANARSNGGQVPSGSFVSRAQSAAARQSGGSGGGSSGKK